MTVVNHVQIRKCRALPSGLLVLRLGLDEVHLCETEDRVVVRMPAAAGRGGQWRELVESHALTFACRVRIPDRSGEDQRLVGAIVYRQSRVEAVRLTNQP